MHNIPIPTNNVPGIIQTEGTAPRIRKAKTIAKTGSSNKMLVVVIGGNRLAAIA